MSANRRKRSTPQGLAALAGRVELLGLRFTYHVLSFIQAPLTAAVWMIEAWKAHLDTEIQRRKDGDQ